MHIVSISELEKASAEGIQAAMPWLSKLVFPNLGVVTHDGFAKCFLGGVMGRLVCVVALDR